VVGPVTGAVGVTIGLGEPPGVGLGNPVIPPLKLTTPRLPSSATAVPQPAMTMTSPTTALTINVHGVR
jgi:hypothetical protein